MLASGAIMTCSVASMCLGEEIERGRDVVFQTADHGTVHGWMIGKGRHGVVLAHGAVFNKESWSGFAKRLAREGFVALALDFRGYGLSQAGTKPDALYEDVLAAVRYLRGLGIERVSLIGASMGGGAAARAAIAADPGEIEKLILLSPVPIEEPDRLKGNLLFIASANEPLAQKIDSQFNQAPEPKRLVWLKGTAHAQHIFKGDQKDQLEKVMIDFLAE